MQSNFYLLRYLFFSVQLGIMLYKTLCQCMKYIFRHFRISEKYDLLVALDEKSDVHQNQSLQSIQ